MDDQWLIGRLERRARDAQQAASNTRNYRETPATKALAEAHRAAAAVYERALAEAQKRIAEQAK